MKQVILRPARGLGYLKFIIVLADLMFLGLPWLMASAHVGGAVVVITAVVSLGCIVACTYFGWLSLGMRVEVARDAVRIYYFLPAPAVIRCDAIADVGTTFLPRGGYYTPQLIMTDGSSRLVGPLTVRTKAQGEEQVALLRAALGKVAGVG